MGNGARTLLMSWHRNITFFKLTFRNVAGFFDAGRKTFWKGPVTLTYGLSLEDVE